MPPISSCVTPCTGYLVGVYGGVAVARAIELHVQAAGGADRLPS